VPGDAVSLASRLEGLNKAYNTPILNAQDTLEELPNDFAYRKIVGGAKGEALLRICRW
jgi:class 3 adenylate cyclase